MQRPSLVVSASLFLMAVPAVAQNVLFSEGFDAGIPATWSQIQRAWTGDVWLPGTGLVNGTPDVWHEAWCNNGFTWRDNTLLSPPIDLSGFRRVDFSCQQLQVSPFARFLNRIEVTTNGGQSFTPVHTVTGTWSGFGTINVSLNAFAGAPALQIGFRYQGTVANEWRIDNVRVTTPQPVHSIINLRGGAPAKFAVDGAVPGNLVVVGLSLSGPGPLPTPFGNVNLTPPVAILPFQTADPNGNVSFSVTIPPIATGLVVHTQAAALQTTGAIELSNWVRTTVL